MRVQGQQPWRLHWTTDTQLLYSTAVSQAQSCFPMSRSYDDFVARTLTTKIYPIRGDVIGML